MKFQIKKMFTMEILFETEAESLKETLEKANLRDANLRGANLRDADLRDANLRDANLRDADLRDANLRGANLRDANLRGANLRDANLRDANWIETKKDMFSKMELMPNEVPFLYKALHDGKVDGSAYEGKCACFCGTFAIAAHQKVDYIPIKIDQDSPIERFFLGIGVEDTPLNNPLSKLASEWVEEFCKEKSILLPTREVIWK